MPTRTRARRPTAGRRRSVAATENPDFSGILELGASLNTLHRQMAATCAPRVHAMIRNRTRDQRQIEPMLDRLLDCACIPEGLALFRALCRYYFTVNPAATASYVLAYRDMWDRDTAEEARRA